MSKILIAVATCRKFRDRAKSQLQTWIPLIKKADVKFFVGGHGSVLPNEVQLNAGDNYLDLPEKVKEIFKWALAHGYDYVFKIDDDVYIDPDRFNSLCETVNTTYSGRLRGSSGGRPAPYASGFAYWVSRQAMTILSEAQIDDKAEDRWVGNALFRAKILCTPDYRYVVAHSTKNAISGPEGPRVGNDVIAVAELTPIQMENEHNSRSKLAIHKYIERPLGDFSDICVVVKTFLRDGHLHRTVNEIENCMPSAKIVIVDDGVNSKEKVKWYSELRARGHKCVWLPFDSGFCAKSNEAIRNCDREYILIASDDFVFNNFVAKGVLRMREVIQSNPKIGVASGRVDENPYDGYLIYTKNEIEELPLSKHWEDLNGIKYQFCDITVNWSLLRKEMFNKGKIIWDEKYKIGGDHFEFFFQVAMAGWKIIVLQDANVNQRPTTAALASPEYAKYRGRAKEALPLFFKKFNLKKYTCFDGRADVLQEDGSVISIAPKRLLSSSNLRSSKSHSKIWVSDKRLYLTEDGKVVEPSSKLKKKLLVAKGGNIPKHIAMQYGLIEA